MTVRRHLQMLRLDMRLKLGVRRWRRNLRRAESEMYRYWRNQP